MKRGIITVLLSTLLLGCSAPHEKKAVFQEHNSNFLDVDGTHLRMWVDEKNIEDISGHPLYATAYEMMKENPDLGIEDRYHLYINHLTEDLEGSPTITALLINRLEESLEGVAFTVSIFDGHQEIVSHYHVDLKTTVSSIPRDTVVPFFIQITDETYKKISESDNLTIQIDEFVTENDTNAK